MVKNLIYFLIAISFLLFWFLGLAVGLLQLLQSKLYTTNIGFIRSLIGELGLESISEMSERFRRLGLDAKARGLKMWRWDLKLKLLSVKTVNNEKFEYFQFKVFFFILISLKTIRQCICSPICLTLTIINLKMIAKKLLCLLNLIKTYAFYVHEVAKVVVISKNKDFVLEIF